MPFNFNPLAVLRKLKPHRKWRILIKRMREEHKYRAKATAAWKSRLPTVLDHSLETSLVHHQLDISTQPKCFFFKLPLEIRLLIYEEVLVRQELFFRVPNENKKHYGDEIGKERKPFKLKCRGARRRLLAFPISCKLAYVDSIDYIYKYNTFRFSGVTPYWYLCRILPSRSFDSIQTLHLQYSYDQASDFAYGLMLGTAPYNRNCWVETCEQISRMKGLKNVRVDIFMWMSYVHFGHEDVFFAPLKELGEKVKLEVCVSWEKDWLLPEEKTWPFILRRNLVRRETRKGYFALDFD